MGLNLIVFVYLATVGVHDKLTTQLKDQLNNAREDDRLSAIIIMEQSYPYGELTALTIKQRAELFKGIARMSQEPIIEYLKNFPSEVDSIFQFWIFNGIYVRASKRIIEELSRRRDILYISHIIETEPIPIIKESEDRPLNAEWNIQRVMADSCWYAGYTGDSIILGMIDTGIDTTHPALSGGKLIKWRDFVNLHPYPYDDHGHGTAGAGIICGGDGLGPFTDDVGVAPGAKLIFAKSFSSYPYTDPLLALQWMACLKSDSGFNIRAINNGWGGSTTAYFWDICNTLKSLEILPIFSIGNMGPQPSTTNSPANYPTVLGLGATNVYDTVAIFSSRGPAPDSSPWNNPTYWFRPDWNLIKPDLSAPGVSVRTCWNNHQYTTINGTSFSCAHATGAAAILFEKNPDLTVTEVYNILLNNADRPLPAPYPNNNYGWGRLNIWKALQSLTGITEKESAKNSLVNLHIAPNPFKNATGIKFQIPSSKSQINPNSQILPSPFSSPRRGEGWGEGKSQISLSIYDASGRLVKSFLLPTSHFQLPTSVEWNGTDDSGRRLPAGVYFVTLRFGNNKKIEKVVLLR